MSYHKDDDFQFFLLIVEIISLKLGRTTYVFIKYSSRHNELVIPNISLLGYMLNIISKRIYSVKIPTSREALTFS